jgi:hypothetical protein
VQWEQCINHQIYNIHFIIHYINRDLRGGFQMKVALWIAIGVTFFCAFIARGGKKKRK